MSSTLRSDKPQRSRVATTPIKPPVIDGVGPSCITLPKGPWETVFAFLEEYFPHIGSQEWLKRMKLGKIIDQSGNTVNERTPYRQGVRVFYYRELEKEVPIPFQEQVLHKDEHLIVTDKPHFLPVTPSGPYVSETLLVRLKKSFATDDIVPVHRIDKDTAGIVIFSCKRDTRAQYAALFRERNVHKIYEAIAPVMPAARFPFVYKSRIIRGEPFFRMRETEGTPNSETSIEMIENRGKTALYRLVPFTGRKHQLRLHLSSLGIPIVNDRLYPEVRHRDQDDFLHPLQLIARSVCFVDPLTQKECRFESGRTFSFHPAGL